MSMTDPLGSASSALDNQSKAALAAINANGTAGLEQFKQAQQGMQSDQSAAIDQALNSTVARGAPDAARAAMSNIISAPAAPFAGALATNQQAYSNLNQAMSKNLSDYMSEAKAAVPAIQADNESQVSLMKARWQAQAQKELNNKSDSELNELARGAVQQQIAGETQKADTQAQTLLDQRAQLQTQADALNKQLDQQRAAAAKQAASIRHQDPDAARQVAQGAVTPEQHQRLAELNTQMLDINAKIQDQVLTNKTQGMTPEQAIQARSQMLANQPQMAQGGQLDSEYKAALEQQAQAAFDDNRQTQIMRDYLVSKGIDPTRVAGMSFGPDAQQQLAELRARQDLAQFPAQAQVDANNLRQKVAAVPQLSAQDAAHVAGLGDNYGELSTMNGTVLDDKGKPQTDKSGKAVQENVLNEVNTTYQQLAAQGDSPDVVDQKLAAALQARYGHDYPTIRNIVATMYNPPQQLPTVQLGR